MAGQVLSRLATGFGGELFSCRLMRRPEVPSVVAGSGPPVAGACGGGAGRNFQKVSRAATEKSSPTS